MNKISKSEIFGLLAAIFLLIGMIYIHDDILDEAKYLINLSIGCFIISIISFSTMIIIKLTSK